MRFEERIGLRRFLDAYLGMRVRPSPPDVLRLEGEFRFRADYKDGPIIEDAYGLQINVPRRFPRDIPTVMELDERIPRRAEYHVFNDGTLCLGSPLRLHLIAHDCPSLTEFSQHSIVPYLYANSYREKTGVYLFGELAHGATGLLDDYAQILGLDRPEQAAESIVLIAMKRRLANKRPCPCGCGLRLGACCFNATVHRLRTQFGRPLFKRFHDGILHNYKFNQRDIA